MPHSSKRKGNRIEREIVQRHRDAGIPAERVPLSGATGGTYSGDLRVGAEDLRIGMPPAKLGLVYHWQGLRRFIQTIGLQRTREMFFTGDTYEGSRALEMGLVDYLLPRKELEVFAHNLAEVIANNAPLSLKGTKRIVNMLLQRQALTEDEALETQALVIEALNSDDLREGQLAFLQRRTPEFKGS